MRSVLLIAGAVAAVAGPALAGEPAAKTEKSNKTVETAAGVAGSVAGSSVAGPVGGFVGGAVGRAVGHAVSKKSDAGPADQTIAAQAEAPPAPSMTPEQRAAAAMDAPPAWADPGQVQREQHSAPPPPAATEDEPHPISP